MAAFLHCCVLLAGAVFLAGGECLSGRPKSHGVLSIVVGPTGFSSIQAAVDSVPSNNDNWVLIDVKPGVYREQVKIPADKTYIYLRGEGMGRTVVMWGAHDTMLSSATFECLAHSVLVSGISFVNSYNYPPNGNPVKPALAAKISGDKTVFFECSFSGYQDTLLDDMGRHYYKQCTIEGAIDFIFGGGQSMFEECTILVNAGAAVPGTVGYIAAQGRDSPGNSGGFVFKQCNVTGKGKTFLGRAWKPYSRALYYECYLSDVVVPLGWDAWTAIGHENQVTFAEYGCQGAGSNMSNRVKWEKTLSPNELQLLASLSYVDSEGWMSKLPIKLRKP